MAAGSALEALLVSALLAGVEPGSPQFPALRAPGPGTQPDAPAVFLRLSLNEISRSQERAFVSHPVGRGSMEFALGFAPKYESWIKFRQGGKTAAHGLKRLETGVEEDFPVERYRLTFGNGSVRAFPVRPPQEPQARVPMGEMLDSLYNKGLHVHFPYVEYAVLYEDGGVLPPSVALLRLDHEGTYWLTHKETKELKWIFWFLAVDGTMYGMRLEGMDLVFHSKPVPPVSRPSTGEGQPQSHPGERRLP